MSEQSSFKIGDKVRLKSGGPLMTVDSIPSLAGDRTNKINVAWFDPEHKDINYAQLSADSVKKEDP